ncbi:MAG TPA: DUF3857 domain-containing protein [Terriglobales bacterium]|jgi:hypothetical protein
MQKAIRLLFPIIIAAGILSNQPLHAEAPDWVKNASNSLTPTYPTETKAIVLLDQSEYSILNPGEYIEHHRRVVKILRPEGRYEGDLGVDLEKQDKISFLHAWSIDHAGHQYELKDKDFVERSPYSGELYEDIRFRIAKAPAADPGSVIAFEYEVHRHAWWDQLDWIFREENPVKEATFTINLPAGWEYKTAWAVASPIEPAKIGDNRWQWTLHDIPVIEDEPHRAPVLSLAGRMEVMFFAPGGGNVNFANWDALGRWYNGLTEGRRTATPEIIAKVTQLTAGKTDFDSKVRSLASFMQTDIRYMGIEIGIGGFQPHPAGDIFHARYGDCKDKATLLSTMLEQVGIHSDYVLINTERGIVAPEAPSSFFNHAILAIEIPQGTNLDGYYSVIKSSTGQQYMIFDPTDEFTPAGNLRPDLQGTYALLVTNKGGEVIHTPTQAPETSLLTRTGHFELNSDGTLNGEVLEDLTGKHASDFREMMFEANQQQRTHLFEEQLNNSLQGASLESADIQQLDDLAKDVTVKLKFSSSKYGQVRGPLMLVRPRVLGEKSFVVERKERHYPFVMSGVTQEADTYEIDIPKDYVVDDIPEPTSIDSGFASYESKVIVDGSKLRYQRKLIIRQLEIPADKVPDLRKFEGIVGADETAAIVLKHVQN